MQPIDLAHLHDPPSLTLPTPPAPIDLALLSGRAPPLPPLPPLLPPIPPTIDLAAVRASQRVAADTARVGATLPEPLPVVRALHTHAVGTAGFFVALLAMLAPAIALLANQDFVNALLWQGDLLTRVQHFHQLVTVVVSSLCIGVLGIGAAHVGKGPLAAAVDDTIRPAS